MTPSLLISMAAPLAYLNLKLSTLKTMKTVKTAFNIEDFEEDLKDTSSWCCSGCCGL
jgi:hypothetical protein